jgi:hypothetical protein
MPRFVLDTIGSNYQQIRAVDCLKFGYLNGKESAWPAAAIDEQTKRGELLGLIDVLGTNPHQASIVDWEHGDVQDPQRLAWWVKERNAFRGDAVVYTNKDSMPGVIQALASSGEYYQLWVADLTANGQPPVHAPDFGLPPNVRLLGVQYAWPLHTKGPFDLSLLFNDSWHAQHHAAAHVLGAAADDAGYEARADEARANQAPADEPAAADEGQADVEPAAADPKAETPAGGTSSVPPWDINPSAYLTSPADPQPDSASPGQGPWDATGRAVAVTEPGPDDPPAIVRPYLGSHAAATTTAAAAGGIDHAAAWRWIQAGEQFVKDFKGAGATHAAGVLEQALGAVLEVGKLLAALGR